MGIKKIVISFLFTLFVCNAFSQVRLGMKAGINITNIKSDYNLSYKNKIRFHAGIVSELPLGKYFLFRSELLYSLKGSRTIYNNTTYNTNLHYINLPLLIGYRPCKQLSILAGPELGYLLTVRINEINFDNSKMYTKRDLGFSGGVCYYPFTFLAIEIRYTYGFTRFKEVGIQRDMEGNVVAYTVDENGNFLRNDERNRSFQIGLNYFFIK